MVYMVMGEITMINIYVILGDIHSGIYGSCGNVYGDRTHCYGSNCHESHSNGLGNGAEHGYGTCDRRNNGDGFGCGIEL